MKRFYPVLLSSKTGNNVHMKTQVIRAKSAIDAMRCFKKEFFKLKKTNKVIEVVEV